MVTLSGTMVWKVLHPLLSSRTSQECRLLRNFSSVYAVVSALQSSPVHRLRAAWGEAARWGGQATRGGWGSSEDWEEGEAVEPDGSSELAVFTPPGTASKSFPASARFSQRRIIIPRAGSSSCR